MKSRRPSRVPDPLAVIVAEHHFAPQMVAGLAFPAVDVAQLLRRARSLSLRIAHLAAIRRMRQMAMQA